MPSLCRLCARFCEPGTVDECELTKIMLPNSKTYFWSIICLVNWIKFLKQEQFFFMIFSKLTHLTVKYLYIKD